jgi:ferredoxin
MAERLTIDRIRCDGYGMCAEMFPEGIELDDWGYPILRPGVIPDRLVPMARQAVDVCPVLALRLAASATAMRPAAVSRTRPADADPVRSPAAGSPARG